MFKTYPLVIIFLFLCLKSISQEDKQKFKDAFKASLVTVTDFSYEFKGDKMQKSEIILKPKFTYRINNISKLVFIGQVYSELNDNLEPGKSKDHTVSKWSRRLFIGDRTNLELRELYYQTKIGGNFRIMLGKQQIVWGETDGLKLLDVVNPQNFREFILDGFEDSRIPLWSLKSEFDLDDIAVQLVWIPDNTYHIIPNFDAPYFTSSLFPKPPEGVSTIFGQVDRPTRFLKDSDAGIKLSTFRSGWDISINYFYYYEDLPAFYNRLDLGSPSGPSLIIEPEYERQHLIGGTFNKVLGSSTLRGEIAYVFDQNFITTDPNIYNGIVTSHVYKSAFGIDYIKGEHIISAQLFSNIISDRISVYNRDRFETNTSLKLSRDMMNDNLTADILWIQNYNHGDGYVRPQLSYWINSSVQLLLESTIFYGNTNQLFGQFQDRNRVSIGMKWGI
ncbi:DUF1302 family protein [uncultured Algibacter sp.]|uniref:DUF1302 family protein n=1 Tax=uncultured Algibacter sp. TaxID=298659 RepID=UPI00262104D1|nr:DUF1302 family protein [uncultured Algibacter sp.]